MSFSRVFIFLPYLFSIYCFVVSSICWFIVLSICLLFRHLGNLLFCCLVVLSIHCFVFLPICCVAGNWHRWFRRFAEPSAEPAIHVATVSSLGNEEALNITSGTNVEPAVGEDEVGDFGDFTEPFGDLVPKVITLCLRVFTDARDVPSPSATKADSLMDDDDFGGFGDFNEPSKATSKVATDSLLEDGIALNLSSTTNSEPEVNEDADFGGDFNKPLEAVSKGCYGLVARRRG